MERKKPTIPTDSIRENARLILDQSQDILTLDYNSIMNVLVPTLASYQKEILSVGNNELNPIPLDREIGVNLFVNVINFCFKDPSNGHEYVFDDGSKKVKRFLGLFMALKESGTDWNNLSLVASLSPEKWKNMVQLSPTNTLYLGEERGVRIKGFARQLCDKGFLTVRGFIGSTGFDTQTILQTLSSSVYFDDEFLKRAQLTVRMLGDVYKAHKMPGFKNTEILTAMADYRIPQVYYNLGSIKLSNWLLDKLMLEELLKPGGREERALRSTVITISEIVAKTLDISEGEVDMLEWTLSQKMAKENFLPIPHMLVATDKY